MASLFAQSITQFAPLRTFARIPHAYAQYSQLIRELFPKALFGEQNVSYNVFVEIAWSFLSAATVEGDNKKWYIDQKQQHRVGGIPAEIHLDLRQFYQIWHKNGKCHRDDKDPRTGLTLPAKIWLDGPHWYKNRKRHRDNKDPRTGLILPTVIRADSSLSWSKNDLYHRDDKDPNTGLTLPAIIWTVVSQYWYKDGKRHRDDKDPNTGLTLPAVVGDRGLQYWFIDGVHIARPI